MKEMCHFPFCSMLIHAPQADQRGTHSGLSTGSWPTAHRDRGSGMRETTQKIKETSRYLAENAVEHVAKRIITRRKNACKNRMGATAIVLICVKVEFLG